MKQNTYKIVLFALLLTMVSCGDETSETDHAEIGDKTIKNERLQVSEAQFLQSKMRLGTLQEKPFPTVITASGVTDVSPENRAAVHTIMGGYIKTTPLLIGDKVTKGQVLVTIENPEFVKIQQQYMEVNEQLTYLKADYDRQTTMETENITSQKRYLKAESDYKTAVAKHLGLEKQLRMLHISPSSVREGKISSVISIYAPISGSISKVNVVKGSYVSPATEILEIINNKLIHLELSVFEKDIMKVEKGQKINFKLPEASTEVYKAQVRLVGSSIETNRTIKVHGDLEGGMEGDLLTGMFVEADIITNAHRAKALPSEAIIIVDEIPYILILDAKEGDTYYFNQVEVEVSESYNGFSIIKNHQGFKPDTQFLTKGTYNLIGE